MPYLCLKCGAHSEKRFLFCPRCRQISFENRPFLTILIWNLASIFVLVTMFWFDIVDREFSNLFLLSAVIIIITNIVLIFHFLKNKKK